MKINYTEVIKLLTCFDGCICTSGYTRTSTARWCFS